MYYLKNAYGDYLFDSEGKRDAWGTRDAALLAAKKRAKDYAGLVVFCDNKALCQVDGDGKVAWLVPMKEPYE